LFHATTLTDPMKRLSKSRSDAGPLLVFGAHPDDIEFGCGGVIALETRLGRPAHFIICSRGEAATNGSPREREKEARKGARLLGATVEFIDLDGDAHLEVKTAHAIKIAGIIRRTRPQFILAPTLVENQHPDHARLGRLVRDASRIARYGGIAELREFSTHAIQQLFYYALSANAEPRDITPVLFDISNAAVIRAWTAAMEAHASQSLSRNYVELQLLRAKSLGASAGIEYATALFPNDPCVLTSLTQTGRGARRF
jgi:LmbE family N-acetylglucosaminyl deacetylase